MKTNGKSNGHSQAEEVQVFLEEAEVGRPILSQGKLLDWAKRHVSPNCKKAFDWYKDIEWDVWWDDFATSLDKTGKPKYRTAWQFVKAMTKNKFEKDLLWEMIGPEPPEEAKLRAPYLGDWQKRRTNTFWSISPGRLESVKAAIKEREEALMAARAVSPLLLPKMARWERLSQKIDEAFNGNPFLPDLPPNHPKNIARVNEYMRLHQLADSQTYRVCDAWFKAHGLDPNDGAAWVAMLGMTAARAGAAGALAGAALAQGTLPNGQQINPWDLLMAQNMREKAEMYPGLTLPDAVIEMPPTKNKPV